MRIAFFLSFVGLLGLAPAVAQPPAEQGIPVTDPLVKSKCGGCHPQDDRGNMQRISWERSTPEGWQEALKKMILKENLTMTPAEARSIVKYLSDTHGLAPEEARPVTYYPERRIHDETSAGNGILGSACTKCHPAARPLSWRRSLDDWKQLAGTHLTQYKMKASDEAIAFLGKAAPLHTPEWDSWSTRASNTTLTGSWLVTAKVQGRGQYVGELIVTAGSSPDEFTTQVKLHSIKDGSVIVRSGRSLLYGGYAWRGRSRGVTQASSAPDDLSSEAREAMWVSPDQTMVEGRWYWGQYQEFGFDVILERPSSGPSLLAIDRLSLQAGSEANRIRVIGDKFPAQVTPADLSFGPGITVRRAIAQNTGEVLVEVDIAANATPGKRDVRFRSSALKTALAIYDRVDYIKVTPESSLAAFGNQKYPRGFQQFEAIGYQRGPDGKLHTADDLELGPIDVTWSMEVFYATDTSRNNLVGAVSSTGLFTPAAESPGVNYDIWVIATASSEKNRNGEPLVGKGYVVVTIPEYSFNGRHYVRDLDRWIEEGTW